MKQGQKLTQNLNFFRLNNQGGQAVVEYVLLLIITVSLLLAAKGLFVGTQNFIKGYAEDYIVCLMEHGELPQLGVGNDDLKKHQGKTNCVAKFSIAGGATLTGGGSGGSGSSSSSGGGSANGKGSQLANNGNGKNSANGANAGKDGKSGSGKNDSGSSDTDSDSAGGRSGRGGGSGNYANGRINRGGGFGVADGAAGSAGGDKVRLLEGQADDLAFGRNGDYDRSSRVSYKNNRYRAITGQMSDEIEKTTKKEPRKPTSRTVSSVKEEEAFRPGPRKSAFVPPERKPTAEYQDKEDDFSFGYLLKWLLIAGMVIAIIIFFGGQVLNYSNSDS